MALLLCFSFCDKIADMAFREELVKALSNHTTPENAEATVSAFEKHIYGLAQAGATEGATKVVKPLYYVVGAFAAFNVLRLLFSKKRQLSGYGRPWR